MTLYYIEKKNYYRDQAGIERQLADEGELPRLYHSYTDAISKAETMIKEESDVFGMKTELDNETYPHYRGDLLYAHRLANYEKGFRTDIKVYSVNTNT